MLRKSLLVGGPLAAAAVIVLAFAGFFDGRGKSKVAGVSEVNPHMQASPAVSQPPASEQELQDWLSNAQRNMDSARRSGESLQIMLDSTLMDVLQAIEDGEAEPASEIEGPIQTPDSTDPSADDGDGAD